ncbi:uncharacterized protein LOC120288492 [Eucalyptus grandis]|uniref:uncharacterized protein LOC120288492 n=1 Tax=Eucalyptus grandis TaxID=71139 RepID=UPI00192E90B2|nr:uncharacterized protein LOC120288492 [Eucalyptus grandis]
MAYGHRSTLPPGQPSFALVYGMEAFASVEVEIPFRDFYPKWICLEAEWSQQRFKQLDLIDKKRLKALCHGQAYQQRVARSFNRKVRPRHFEVNDLVLRKLLPIFSDPGGKFAPNYSGSYVVKKVLPGGALILAELDGREFFTPVNSDVVKKYYP